MPTLNRIAYKLLAQEPYAGKVDSNKDRMMPTNKKELGQFLKSAGFTEIDIMLKTKIRYWASTAEAFEFVEASSSGSFMKHVPASIAGDLRRDIESELTRNATSAGIENQSYTLEAYAAKP